MLESKKIKYSKTFKDYRQFSIVKEETDFQVGKFENLFFGFRGLAYKIHKIGTRENNNTKVFYFKGEIGDLFKNNNEDIQLDDLIEIIITNDSLDEHGLTIAT